MRLSRGKAWVYGVSVIQYQFNSKWQLTQVKNGSFYHWKSPNLSYAKKLLFFTNQLLPTKSTTLNPMVKLDLCDAIRTIQQRITDRSFENLPNL